MPPPVAAQLLKIAPTGSGSFNSTEVATLGPLLRTVIVYVRGLFVTTGSGVSTFEITSRSACAMTFVMAVAELLVAFGSKSEVVTVAVLFRFVPFGVAGSTLTTIVKVAVSPLATEALVHRTAPAIRLQLQPETDGNVTNVVLAGSGSLTTTLAAASGPSLVRLIV